MMEDPNLLFIRLKLIFQIVCVLLAIYMSASFVKRFNENDNATSIAYKKYSTTYQDKYPTFSICFKGAPFHWYYEMDIYNAFELTYWQYQKMLRGEPAFRYVYDPFKRLFLKLPAFVNNGSTANSEKFHLKFSDFLLEADFISLDERHSRFYRKGGRGDSNASPFKISFQTPDMICFSRDPVHVSNLIRLQDSLIFNETLMENEMYKRTRMLVYIHYPFQLIRSLDIASFSSSFFHYQSDKLLSFKMSQSTIVKRRSDSREACNDEIEDYDAYLIHQVVKKMNCIPSYWLEIIQEGLELQECTSPKELSRAYQYLENWQEVMESHDRPCIEMFNTVAWNWQDAGKTRNTKELKIKFYYQEQYYQELQYLPDFDLETFISNIGGFVGIFLGYSMMQFPELLGKR